MSKDRKQQRGSAVGDDIRRWLHRCQLSDLKVKCLSTVGLNAVLQGAIKLMTTAWRLQTSHEPEVCVAPVSVLWILCRGSEVVRLLADWTVVLTAVQVLQHKFLDALPGNTHKYTSLTHNRNTILFKRGCHGDKMVTWV